MIRCFSFKTDGSQCRISPYYCRVSARLMRFLAIAVWRRCDQLAIRLRLGILVILFVGTVDVAIAVGIPLVAAVPIPIAIAILIAIAIARTISIAAVGSVARHPATTEAVDDHAQH